MSTEQPRRSSLILVDRGLVRECASLLKTTIGWRQRPCRRVIDLVYALNTLSDSFAWRRYDYGLPQPSIVLRDLSRLAKLVHAATIAKSTDRLVRRVELLVEKSANSVEILVGLLFTTRQALSGSRDKALAMVLETAKSEPQRFLDLINRAQALDYSARAKGKGGRRAKPSPGVAAILDAANAVYARATGLRMLGVDRRSPQVEISRFNRLVGLLHRKLLGPINGHALRELIARHYPIRARRPIGQPRVYRNATRKPRPLSI
jgi:hypothetical protein